MRRHRGTHGFTLIEVLVTTGIFSLLLTMVLPMFHKVRENAKRVQCTSNLRQIGVAYHVYFERAAETPGAVPYAPDVSAGYAGRAPLVYPVDSDIVKPVRTLIATMYPTHDPYTEEHTYNFPGGRYWKTVGDGTSIYNWDFNVYYPDLWGGVAGEGTMDTAFGEHLCGTGDADGFGFRDRVLNPSVFMGMQAMSNASKAATVFRCPGDDSRWKELGNSYSANLRPSVPEFYNDQGELVPFWAALNFTNTDSVRHPGRTVLAGDAGWMRAVRNDGAPWLAWHGRDYFYNLLFLDGHVRFLYVEPGQQSGPGWTCDASEEG